MGNRCCNSCGRTVDWYSAYCKECNPKAYINKEKYNIPSINPSEKLCGKCGETIYTEEAHYCKCDKKSESERIPGMKFDQEKTRPTLLLRDMPRAVNAVLDVLEFGARKYAPRNWQHVENALDRYMDALLRHLLLKLSGKDVDEESGKSISAHIACNALFLLELELRTEK